MLRYAIILLSLSLTLASKAQPTVGLVNYVWGNLEGYVLFSPIPSNNVYLIDKCGEKVHEWATTRRPSLAAYLLEDGSLLRAGYMQNSNFFMAGGGGGVLERFDWNGNLTWSYVISDSTNYQHHDFKPLANGNILVIAWDRYSRAMALEQGLDTAYSNAYLWGEKLVELHPIGTNDAEVVWEWKVWDHLMQDVAANKPNYYTLAEHPELIDLNYFPGQGGQNMDWIHFNSIDYNAELDQILLSSHTLNEVWIIDHSTTTAAAATHTGGNAGKGGDLLYRWGNPQAYGRGNPSAKQLYGQHHANWIPEGTPHAGKILIFNNGLGRPGTYSSVDMIATPSLGLAGYASNGSLPYLPDSAYWSFVAPTPTDFYSSNIGGAYPLANGSFLISEGTKGKLFEIDSNRYKLWEYISPVSAGAILSQGANPQANLVFKGVFYPDSYPAFSGLELVPMGEIELNPSSPSVCELVVQDAEQQKSKLKIYPNPARDKVWVKLETGKVKAATVTNGMGQIVLECFGESELLLAQLPIGLYTLKILDEEGMMHLSKLAKD